MKALLAAAAILAPVFVFAEAPVPHVTDLTSIQVLGKLRMIHQTSIEWGTLAQSNSQSPQVKALGAAMVKEHAALDAKVTDFALKNNIVLSSRDVYDDAVVAVRTPLEERDRGPATEVQAADENPSQTPPIPNSPEVLAKRQALMDQLRSLKGPAFDRELLTRIVADGERWMAALQNRKGTFDAVIDAEVGRTFEAVKRQVGEARRLQTALRSS